MSIQLVVEHYDGIFTYHQVLDSWKIDSSRRCVIIGRGVPRTYIPLDSVRSFTAEEYAAQNID